MKGYTYIERSLNDSIENQQLDFFLSYPECCAAAEMAAMADNALFVAYTEVCEAEADGECDILADNVRPTFVPLRVFPRQQ